MNLSSYFTHYWPIWVKFGLSDLHITLLSICEFRENKQARENRTFLMGLNKITFTHVSYF